MLNRLGWTVAIVGALVLGAGVLWLRLAPQQAAPPPATSASTMSGASAGAAHVTPLAAGPRAAIPAHCAGPAAEQAATTVNAASLETAAVAPSGPAETGWSAYLPLVMRELRTACPPDTPGFAAALAVWRKARGEPGGGVMDAVALKAMVVEWLLRRPFVQATRRGECPPAPDPSGLATALAGETLGGKTVQGAPAALEAWRRMKAAARAEAPEIGADAGLLALGSGFRGPEEEAARCAERGCDTVRRSRCSAHRTGAALDLVLTTAPGAPTFSSAEVDRKALVRTPAYLWLAANADRFGFTPYPYEPWHWEWTGALSPAPAPR